jgi:predicted nucleic acid-binding protein
VILVDTSVWVEHFRAGNPALARLLNDDGVACHPFVIGELACGNLRDREEVLGHLARLPETRVATHQEALHLVARRALAGAGLGWVDVHLLASALLSGVALWTLDRPLRDAARQLGCAAAPDN